jgi:transaldolase
VKLFLDSADLAEIDGALARGVACGVTTNPILIKPDPEGGVISLLRAIVEFLEKDGHDFPLSFQVMARTPEEISRQARFVCDQLDYKSLVVKVPCGWESLRVIHELAADGMQINATACMTAAQGLLAAQAGARYVSFFAGKMSDAGLDPRQVIAEAAPLVSEHGAELIAGSLRRAFDVTEFARAGAHITTVPWRYFELLAEHPKTVEAVDLFAERFQPFQ